MLIWRYFGYAGRDCTVLFLANMHGPQTHLVQQNYNNDSQIMILFTEESEVNPPFLNGGSWENMRLLLTHSVWVINCTLLRTVY